MRKTETLYKVQVEKIYEDRKVWISMPWHGFGHPTLKEAVARAKSYRTNPHARPHLPATGKYRIITTEIHREIGPELDLS